MPQVNERRIDGSGRRLGGSLGASTRRLPFPTAQPNSFTGTLA
jgi:hypothetical protein